MSASEIICALVIIASSLMIAWRELLRTREVNQPGILGKPGEVLVLLRKPR
jgi:hypothetical protein